MQTQTFEGGFSDPPVEAARAFRAVMTAMARPADIAQVTGATPPAPLSVAAGVVVLTLCDPETAIFLAPSHDTQAVRDWITFQTGAPVACPAEAQFAIGIWDELPRSQFNRGTSEYPDRSATLIVEMDVLDNSGAVLRGPGIEDKAQLSLPQVDAFVENAAAFPLGLDFIFTSADRLAALPRTTRVSAPEVS